MLYLLFAILSSALIAILMRLSANRVKHNVAMLVMNYVTCLAVACCFTGWDSLIPRGEGVAAALAMGAAQGTLYLSSFVLLQRSVQKNGVVLSTVFMKLGLLVPMVVSVFWFGETPGLWQVLGFVLALGAIILINLGDGSEGGGFRPGLLLLLLSGGCGDVMSKVFEELGRPELGPRFLLYTFGTALILCVLLMAAKGQRPGMAEVCFGAAIGVPNYFSSKFLLKALETVPAVIAYPTFNVGAILVVTLTGVFLFRERLVGRKRLALAAILAALVLLNI